MVSTGSEDLVERRRADDRQHPLLALARHDLDRCHARLTARHSRHLYIHTELSAGGRLARGAAEPSAAQVLDPDDESLVEEVEGGFYEAFLLERVANLDAWPLRVLLGLIPRETRRSQHTHAPDPVTAGEGTQEDGEVADAGRPPEHEALDREQAETEHVDERIAPIGPRERELTTDGRHADRVAVSGDAPYDAIEDEAAAGVVELTEEQRIHERYGTGSHGEHIAEDSAYACRRPLIWLDSRRVIVALDTHGDSDAVSDVHDAGVLARPHKDVASLGGQAPQMDAGRLIRAMLAPHHRIHGELERHRFPTENIDDERELAICQSEHPVYCVRVCVAHGRSSRASTARRPARLTVHECRIWLLNESALNRCPDLQTMGLRVTMWLCLPGREQQSRPCRTSTRTRLPQVVVRATRCVATSSLSSRTSLSVDAK